ncbi:acyltransferase family protein [Streptomyces stelliscabiei]|uniref:acyltransferase family protein n=1 Tax=Streptomyces stelliscabiei TaxID=146820 RepID=UPI003A93C23D
MRDRTLRPTALRTAARRAVRTSTPATPPTGTARWTPCGPSRYSASSWATGWSPPWSRTATHAPHHQSAPAHATTGPVSWILQTLAVFFLVGGHVANQEPHLGPGTWHPLHPWLRARLTRLFMPVAALLALWTVVTIALLATGTRMDTVETLLKLALSPLWFLLVFAALTAATPLLIRPQPALAPGRRPPCGSIRFGLGGRRVSAGSTWHRAGWSPTRWARPGPGASWSAGGRAGPCWCPALRGRRG